MDQIFIYIYVKNSRRNRLSNLILAFDKKDLENIS